MGPRERDLRCQTVEGIRLQSCLQRVVVGESRAGDRVDLRKGWEPGVVWSGGLLTIETRRVYATRPICCSERRLVDIQKLELVNAVISNIGQLENKSLTQFLLDIDIPFLRIWGFQVALNARNVERRCRCARAEDSNANIERNRRVRYDRESRGWADRILRESFLEVGQRNRIVVNAEACTEDGLASWNNRPRRCPGEGNARTEIALWSIVEVRCLNQPLTRIKNGEASARFVHRRKKIVT